MDEALANHKELAILPTVLNFMPADEREFLEPNTKEKEHFWQCTAWINTLSHHPLLAPERKRGYLYPKYAVNIQPLLETLSRLNDEKLLDNTSLRGSSPKTLANNLNVDAILMHELVQPIRGRHRVSSNEERVALIRKNLVAGGIAMLAIGTAIYGPAYLASTAIGLTAGSSIRGVKSLRSSKDLKPKDLLLKVAGPRKCVEVLRMAAGYGVKITNPSGALAGQGVLEAPTDSALASKVCPSPAVEKFTLYDSSGEKLWEMQNPCVERPQKGENSNAKLFAVGYSLKTILAKKFPYRKLNRKNPAR